MGNKGYQKGRLGERVLKISQLFFNFCRGTCSFNWSFAQSRSAQPSYVSWHCFSDTASAVVVYPNNFNNWKESPWNSWKGISKLPGNHKHLWPSVLHSYWSAELSVKIGCQCILLPWYPIPLKSEDKGIPTLNIIYWLSLSVPGIDATR